MTENSQTVPGRAQDSAGVNLSKNPGYGCFGTLLIGLSILFTIIFFPLGVCFYVVKVVAEYERAVLFRLGRIKSGGAKGPGINFSFTLKILILI